LQFFENHTVSGAYSLANLSALTASGSTVRMTTLSLQHLLVSSDASKNLLVQADAPGAPVFRLAPESSGIEACVGVAYGIDSVLTWTGAELGEAMSQSFDEAGLDPVNCTSAARILTSSMETTAFYRLLQEVRTALRSSREALRDGDGSRVLTHGW
jgi:hypothetical protein